MKVLFITTCAYALDKAIRMQADGNEVFVYVQDKKEAFPGEGLVNFIDDYKTKIDWADLIYVDNIGFGTLVDWLKDNDYPVVGTNRYANFAEVDRDYGTRIMKACGIKTPPSFDFETMDEGIEHVKSNPSMYVVKPNDAPSHKTYIGQMPDGSDVIGMMEYFKMYPKETSRGLQLQQRIDGVEIAVSAFFNGKDFVKPFFYNLEHKKLCSGDIGPGTGEMGTTIWTADHTDFFDKTLNRIKPFLQKIDYRNICDINCIVTEKEVYAIEFTMRPGYPISYGITELFDEAEAEFYLDLSTGEAKSIKVKPGFGIVVLLAVPDFPLEKQYKDISLNMPIFGITKDNIDSVHFCSSRWNGKGYECYGNYGDPMCITGSGKSIQQARAKCYDVVSQIKIPNMFYRNDIGDYKDEQKIQALKDWGYI